MSILRSLLRVVTLLAATVGVAATTSLTVAAYAYDGPVVVQFLGERPVGADNPPPHASGSPAEVVASERVGREGTGRTPELFFVAPQPTPASQTLFHYTDEAGQAGIVDSGRLNPSLRSVNPSDARYGDGQYLSDIAPGTKTCAQLSRCFLGQPFQGQRFTHYVEIDVNGLDIVKGRPGVFVNPSDAPLDLTNRIVSTGRN